MRRTESFGTDSRHIAENSFIFNYTISISFPLQSAVRVLQASHSSKESKTLCDRDREARKRAVVEEVESVLAYPARYRQKIQYISGW